MSQCTRLSVLDNLRLLSALDKAVAELVAETVAELVAEALFWGFWRRVLLNVGQVYIF